jgi:hypothetical protein
MTVAERRFLRDKMIEMENKKKQEIERMQADAKARRR